jgi:glycosyltransferase involved in cell wall biosynthesis
MVGVRVFTAFGDSGYGIAGLAYVRALVNSGVPVHWTMFDWPNGSMSPPQLITPVDALARWSSQANDPRSNDLAALVRATSQPVRCDVAFLHTVPEHIPYLRQSGLRNVIYTTWEASRIPPHWLALLDSVDAIAVPSHVNRDAFTESGVRRPVSVVPHIRRAFWHEFSATESAALLASLGLQSDRLTLLSLNTNQPRKNLHQLVRTYCRAFASTSQVQLIIKSSEHGERAQFPFEKVRSETLLSEWVQEEAVLFAHEPPPIRWICSDELSARDIDLLYAVSDCYVSLSHGEGWGIGAFDAAANAIPVVMPAWGGHRDFLLDPWGGMVPCSLQSSPPWPMSRPSFWPDQKWAVMQDSECIKALRSIPENINALRVNATRHQAFIADEFSEARVARALVSVLQGVQ